MPVLLAVARVQEARAALAGGWEAAVNREAERVTIERILAGLGACLARNVREVEAVVEGVRACRGAAAARLGVLGQVAEAEAAARRRAAQRRCCVM